MEYKINLHAHSIFSDGVSSPLAMAMKAKELGFSALVITDHFYGDKFPEVSMTKGKWYLFEKACREAKKIIPVIKGLEVPILGGEVLFFGGSSIKWILDNGIPGTDTLRTMRRFNDTAMILCHPSHNFKDLVSIIDGFEHYNSGYNFFKRREFGPLEGKVRWCNSDAHHADGLETAFNLVDTKIETETDLIKYILKEVSNLSSS